jgi:queuine/archaeosine tRNA-ribosyltransferase
VLTLHNLRFYQQLVGLLREAIAAGDEVELQRLRVAAKRATEAA